MKAQKLPTMESVQVNILGQNTGKETTRTARRKGFIPLGLKTGRRKKKQTTRTARWMDLTTLYWYQNGQPYFEGNYKEGKLMTAKSWKKMARNIETDLVDGNGKVFEYHSDGNKWQMVSYKGQGVGPYIMWYENGQKKEEGFLKSKMRSGFGQYGTRTVRYSLKPTTNLLPLKANNLLVQPFFDCFNRDLCQVFGIQIRFFPPPIKVRPNNGSKLLLGFVLAHP